MITASVYGTGAWHFPQVTEYPLTAARLLILPVNFLTGSPLSCFMVPSLTLFTALFFFLTASCLSSSSLVVSVGASVPPLGNVLWCSLLSCSLQHSISWSTVSSPSSPVAFLYSAQRLRKYAQSSSETSADSSGLLAFSGLTEWLVGLTELLGSVCLAFTWISNSLMQSSNSALSLTHEQPLNSHCRVVMVSVLPWFVFSRLRHQ